MNQALYRNYRPRTFAEVVGQDHIVATLQKAIASGRISHAYLFTGPHGVGKTSVARILAHEVNNLPYDGEAIHLDIIEIDAASNRRIDEIRELRDKVHVSPTSAKYKVYIIDEVHMLTREAFNALLKTLEEPPAHCIFILATTEAHKLPETIVSRTQRFEFKPIAAGSAAGHLAQIAKKEKIDIEPQALELLAEHGEGSFRDSISLLDQLSSQGGKITEADVQEFLGLPPASLINNLVKAIYGGNVAAALQALDEVRAAGSNAAQTAKLLAKEVRHRLISNPANASSADLLRQLVEVPGSFSPEDALEIALLQATGSRVSVQPEVVVEESVEVVTPKPEEVAEPEKPAKPAVKKPRATPVELGDQAWEEIVSRVKDQAASLYTALRLATPEASDGKLVLTFQFPLHQKKVNQAQHKELIAQVVAEVTGQNLHVEPVVKPGAAAPKPKAARAAKDEGLQTISNIFGSPEVLESGTEG